MSERIALSPAEAAEALGCTRQTVYALISRGQLRSFKVDVSHASPPLRCTALLVRTPLMRSPDAARRPGQDLSAAHESSPPEGTDRATVLRRRVTVDDLFPVPDWPLPGCALADGDLVDLVAVWGERVRGLVDSGALQVRRGRGAWYYRPAGWRSLTLAEQAERVVSLLNGDGTREAA